MMKKINLKKILLVTFLMLSVFPAAAQSATSEINTVLNDWAKPAFIGVTIISVCAGVVKNWGKINDDNNSLKKEGWLNVAYIVGYALVGLIVISFVVSRVSSLSLTI